MLVAGSSAQDAVVILPMYSGDASLDTARFDLAGLKGQTVELFGRDRQVTTAHIADVGPPKPSGPNCTAWPTARLMSIAPPSTSPATPWMVGFLSAHAKPLPLDSIDVLSGADSARLVADVARLASSLPGDTAAVFHGVPFVVRSVRRFEPVPGVDAFVAEVVRRLNQEANPLQEQLLLIAERDSARASGRYEAAYTERATGVEDSLETTDVLAGVVLEATHQPALILMRDYGDGSVFALIERMGSRRWRLRWSSAFAGC